MDLFKINPLTRAIRIDKLTLALASDRRAKFLPALRDAATRRRAVEHSLESASQRLLTYERVRTKDALSADEARELDKVLAERATLDPEYRKLAASGDENETQASEIKVRLAEAQKRAYQLRYPVRMMQSTLEAMGTWAAGDGDKLGTDEREAFRERMVLQGREVAELTRMLGELEDEITRDKALLGVVSAAEARADEVRTRYAATLEREQQILGAVAARQAGPEGAVDPGRAEFERLRLVIGAYYAEMSRFAKQLDDLVEVQLRDVRARVLVEVRAIAAARAALDEEQRAAREVVGEVAAVALAQVRQRFADIVLRADVGIVDVAWAVKEQDTRDISRRVNEQRRELQVLDAEFLDVLRDDE